MAIVEATVRRKIEGMYCARAELVRTLITRDAESSSLDHPASDILVFALFGHASARFCYAWEADGRVKTALDHDLASATVLGGSRIEAYDAFDRYAAGARSRDGMLRSPRHATSR